MPWISNLKFLLSSFSPPNIEIAACVCVYLFVALFICAKGNDCVTVASGVMMVLSLQEMKDASCLHMREKKKEINVASGEKGRANVSFEKQSRALRGRRRREEEGMKKNDLSSTALI